QRARRRCEIALDAAGKLPAQSDSLDLRGASAPASDTGPSFCDRAWGAKTGFTRYAADYIAGSGVCKRFTFPALWKKTMARSATATNRFAPRLFQQSIRLFLRRGLKELRPPSPSRCRNPY